MSTINVAWCSDPAVAEAAAALFVAEADPSYISHGELQGGRAVAPGVWASDLADKLRESLREAAARPLDQSGTHFVAMMRERRLMGFAMVSFAYGAKRPYAVLEDLIVSAAARGQGLGTSLLDWLAGECQSRGLTRIFLESGIANEAAHAFFERHGFETVSIVKMREL